MIKASFWRITSILCALATMAAVYSCYDDTDLKNSLEDLTDRVEELEDFRDQVQSEIASLNDIINKLQKQVTVDNFVFNGDGYTINFSDGSKITISNGEDGKDGMTPPSITVIESNGVYYWAYLNADGTTTPIRDKDGNRIPVTDQAPLVRINQTTGNWEISTDGGLSWQDTGMPSTGGSGQSVFADVTEDENYVYFHLLGDTVITVPKTAELSFSFGTDEDPLFFEAGESKTLDYRMSGAVEVAISKPEGWKASIESAGFVITAPAADNSFAETEGTISVFMVAANGQSLISRLDVMIGSAPVEYDYEFELSHVVAQYYGNDYTDTHNWVFYFSDQPLNDDWTYPAGTNSYTLDLYSYAPDNIDNPLPAAGEYVLDDNGDVYMTVAWAMTYPSLGNGYVAMLNDASINISYEGDNMVLDGVMTDAYGKTHHITFSNPVSVTNYSSYDPGTGEDPQPGDGLNIDATYAYGNYSSDMNDVMEVLFTFSDMPIDEYGWPTPPGNEMQVMAYMPFDIDGNISTGTYEVTADYGASMTIAKGYMEIDEYWGRRILL